MEHYAAIDVSLEWSSICIVDPSGRIVREAKVRSEREALVDFFQARGLTFARPHSLIFRSAEKKASGATGPHR